MTRNGRISRKWDKIYSEVFGKFIALWNFRKKPRVHNASVTLLWRVEAEVYNWNGHRQKKKTRLKRTQTVEQGEMHGAQNVKAADLIADAILSK